MQNERFSRGQQKLAEVDGNAGIHVMENLRDISPDLGRYIIEHVFGDIYCREGLDLKSKEIAVVAALTAMGNARPQLAVHLHGALNTGSTVNELKEVILQMSAYAGFPCCINAMNVLKEVLHERGEDGINDDPGALPSALPADISRYDTGKKALAALNEKQEQRIQEAFGEISPSLPQYIIEYGYGDIFSRDNLDIRYRQIATIAALTAMGTGREQLKFHIHGGLNIGITKKAISEIMILMSVYAGFPAALNGTAVLRDVLGEYEQL